MNYRRDGYDYDARYEDGLGFYKDKELFDTIMTRLQMQSYVCVADFVYAKGKSGVAYSE